MRSKSEEFVVIDDGKELFRSWSMAAVVRFLKVINCDCSIDRIAQAIDRTYKQNRSPLDKLEIMIDIREEA